MKIKFVISLVLAVVCLLPIAAGVSTAQQNDPNKTNLDYQVYLPFVSKPPCTYLHPTAYAAVSKPVVKVGQVVTITGALVNDCAYVGQPYYVMQSTPEGILSPSHAITNGVPPYVLNGSYQEMTFTLRAVETGAVAIDFSARWETQDPRFWDVASASPVIIRVLP